MAKMPLIIYIDVLSGDLPIEVFDTGRALNVILPREIYINPINLFFVKNFLRAYHPSLLAVEDDTFPHSKAICIRHRR